MATDGPNTRTVSEGGLSVKYQATGDRLRIEYHVVQGKGWLEFNPANLKVWLNDIPLKLVRRIVLNIDREGAPEATLTFDLAGIDIDADSLLALEALVRAQSEQAEEDIEEHLLP